MIILEPVSHFSLTQCLIDVSRKFRYWFAGLIAPAYHFKYTPRPMFCYMQAQGMFNLVGAEIGVSKGENSKSIMEMIKPAKLFLVDPYKAYFENGRVRHEYERHYKEAKKRMRPYSQNVVFIKKCSCEAVKDLPMLDFVYIDGNHEYEYVKEDLKLYFEKLRVGGVIGGHDLLADFLGVCRAVIEFSKWHNLKLYGKRSDFWFVKTS